MPIVSLSANPINVNAGQSVTLSFKGLLAKSCIAPWKNGQWVSGSVSAAVTQTTTYALSCTLTSSQLAALFNDDRLLREQRIAVSPRVSVFP